jgi:thioredoxin-dependent peroxiredoxin
MTPTQKYRPKKSAAGRKPVAIARKRATGAKPSPDSSALEGKKAPDFALPAADGRTVALRDLLGGKNLVLYFYPRDMTPGCTVEACSFRDNRAALGAAGAGVVGISGDSADSHVKFANRYGLNFPLLSDAGNEVARRYGVYKMKSLYGRKFMGIERTTFVIDRAGVVRKVFPKVKVKGHTEEVIEALKALR